VFGSIALKGTARSGQAYDGTVDLSQASVSSMAFSSGWPGRDIEDPAVDAPEWAVALLMPPTHTAGP